MGFLSGRPLSTKVLLLCLTFLLPIGFLMYRTISAYGKDISFAEYEVMGVRYLRPLVTLMQAVGEHRTAPSGYDLASEAGDAMGTLERVQSDYGTTLQFTEEGLASRKRERFNAKSVLEQVQSIAQGKAEEGAHAQAIADIRGMIGHAGDTSNLVLDPDLDTYYLMDVVLLALPQNQDRLLQVQLAIAPWAQKRSLTAAEQAKAGTYAAMLQEADADRISADLTTAVAEDKNFYGVYDALQNDVPAAQAKYRAALDPVIAGLRQASETGQFPWTVDAYKDAFESARKQSYAFWHVAALTLESLLKIRVDSYTAQRTSSITTSLLTLAVLLAFAYFMVRRIATSLAQATQSIAAEADKLVQVTKSVEGATTQLSASSTQQAAAIEETVASMEEMTAMLAQTSQNSQSCLQATETGRAEAAKGKQIVEKMSRAMNEIHASNDKLQSLVALIGEIQSKTKVINDIVFETRLLSFNASIEAARAGQHGKGFAVVAEEVGKLAAMSGKAADEIRSLLENSAREVSEVVKGTQERVKAGITVTEEAAANFMAMDQSMEGITQSVSNITTATREQETGVRQTNQAMTEMDSLTQKNSVNADNLSQQAHMLSDSSTSLHSSVADIYRIVFGASGKVAHVSSRESQNNTTRTRDSGPAASKSNIRTLAKSARTSSMAPPHDTRTQAPTQSVAASQASPPTPPDTRSGEIQRPRRNSGPWRKAS